MNIENLKIVRDRIAADPDRYESFWGNCICGFAIWPNKEEMTAAVEADYAAFNKKTVYGAAEFFDIDGIQVSEDGWVDAEDDTDLYYLSHTIGTQDVADVLRELDAIIERGTLRPDENIQQAE